MRRPLRILWYRYLKKGFHKGVRRPLRILWYRYLKKGFYLLKRKIRLFLLYQIKKLLMIFHKPLSYIDYYKRSLKIILEDPADIYHAHDLNTLPLAVIAANRTGGRIIYDSHELFTEISNMSPLERLFARALERILIRHAHKVVTVNESIANELIKRYTINKPTIIMNCPTKFSNDNNIRHKIIQSILNINNNEPIILYQGGFSPHRGLDNLILATYYLTRGVLVLMGWGKLENELKRLVYEMHLENKVFFLDPVPQDVLIYYSSSAHLGVIPYQAVSLNNYYSTPNKLFEYIAAGIPVVGSDFPELKRIIEGYNIGRTFNPEDPKDIARAIEEVLNDPKQYEEMQKNVRRAAEIFNWENESQKLLELYDCLERECDRTDAFASSPARIN